MSLPAASCVTSTVRRAVTPRRRVPGSRRHSFASPRRVTLTRAGVNAYRSGETLTPGFTSRTASPGRPGAPALGFRA